MRETPQRRARRPPEPVLIHELLDRIVSEHQTCQPQLPSPKKKKGPGGLISRARLRRLRNDVNIRELISVHLKLPAKEQEGIFRFRCPLCTEFNSTTNPKTNLARCFRCGRNFNPIDMVMAVRECRFLHAVAYLSSLLRSPQRRTR